MEAQKKPAEKPHMYDRLFMKAHNRITNPEWKPSRGAFLMLWQAGKSLRDAMKELWLAYLEQLRVAEAFQDAANNQLEKHIAAMQSAKTELEDARGKLALVRDESGRAVHQLESEIRRLEAANRDYGAKINELMLGDANFARAVRAEGDLKAANLHSSELEAALKKAEAVVAERDNQVSRQREVIRELQLTRSNLNIMLEDAKRERGRRNSEIHELRGHLDSKNRALGEARVEVGKLQQTVADFKSGKLVANIRTSTGLHVPLARIEGRHESMFDDRTGALKEGARCLYRIGDPVPTFTDGIRPSPDEKFMVLGQYVHVVQPQDNIFSIARKYYGPGDQGENANRIKNANPGVQDWDRIFPGQLVIPPTHFADNKTILRFVEEMTYGATPPEPIVRTSIIRDGLKWKPIISPQVNIAPGFVKKGGTTFSVEGQAPDGPAGRKRCNCVVQFDMCGDGPDVRFTFRLSTSAAFSAKNGTFDMEAREVIKSVLGQTSWAWERFYKDMLAS